MTIRPKTFEAFIAHLVEGGCSFANAKTGRRLVRFRDRVRYFLGSRQPLLWEDYNEYGSTNRRGKQIIHRESFGVRRYSVHNVRDDRTYDVVNTAGETTTEPLNIKCLLTAWDRLNRIEHRIPGIKCNVVSTIDVGPSGFYTPMTIAMDPRTKNSLLTEAADLKLQSFPLAT